MTDACESSEGKKRKLTDLGKENSDAVISKRCKTNVEPESDIIFLREEKAGKHLAILFNFDTTKVYLY